MPRRDLDNTDAQEKELAERDLDEEMNRAPGDTAREIYDEVINAYLPGEEDFLESILNAFEAPVPPERVIHDHETGLPVQDKDKEENKNFDF